MHCVDERVTAGGSEEGTYRSILLNGRDLLCIMVFAALDADEVDADAAVAILGPNVLVLVVIHFAAACALTFGAAWAFALRLSLKFSNLERRLDVVRVLAWAACAWGEQVWSSGNRWLGQNWWLHFCKVEWKLFGEFQKKAKWYIRRMAGGSKSFYRLLVRRWAALTLVPFSQSQRSSRSQCACPLGCLDLLPDGKPRVYCIEDLIRIAESAHHPLHQCNGNRTCNWGRLD